MQTTLNEYKTLSDAYDFFNHKLFAGELPDCLITLQHRSANSLGYYHPERFTAKAGEDKVDEICLNPDNFKERSNELILSTLVHEMAHLWDKNFRKPARKGYHGKSWGVCMKKLGLYPSNTGAPGGRETGQQMDHYIVEGGKFAVACAQFLEHGSGLGWYSAPQLKAASSKKSSKTKFTCPDCAQNAWAKPTASLMCGACQTMMEPEEA